MPMASSLKKEMQMQEFNVSELGSKVWDPSFKERQDLRNSSLTGKRKV